MTERDDEHRPQAVEVKVHDKRIKPVPDEPVPEQPAGDEPEVVEDDLARAQREAEEARAQAAGYLDDLQRLKAEFENYRKRMAREQTTLLERASASVVERLLPILDNFQLALLAADRTKDYESMVRGVELVYSELYDLLEKEGLERIDALNQPFDPSVHEAVMRAEGEGDELICVDEMRPGYKIGGRVVRPAMVKVGFKKE